MSDVDLQQRLTQAQEAIDALYTELAETNRGMLALTLELEQRVDERTTELRTTQEELQRTNSELLQLTLELEDRIAERTAELQAKGEEIKAMTQQLWQTAKLATMGELAASLAHELNNPLAIVSLRIESLLGQVLAPDPKRQALEVIDREVERMGNLVTNLLHFSRRSTQQISTFDVCEELEQTLELIQYHLRNHHITVVRQFTPGVSLVLADRQQLRQVFLNLLTNASDAMPRGGILTLRVAEVTTSTGETGIHIEVSDTGSGIAPEDLPQVMEPFFTTKAEGKGTGLGLPICRRIVQEHHGTLELTSVVDQGTTVHLVLPITNGANSAYIQGLEGEASDASA
ncbi:MAG TPA: ATP-binding protein [Candidatus Tectomicrobia bacterium]